MSHHLLQLAADAAGFHYDPTRRDVRGLWIVRPGTRSGQGDQILWNPLKDSAQAHQLRILLGLVLIDADSDYPYVVCQDLAVTVDIPVHVKIGVGKAEQRAIVLAAAEIEKRKNK